MLYIGVMKSAIIRACDLVGAANIARHLGVSPQAVNEWKVAKRPVPLDRCVQIEQATNGEVTCEELRPDKADYWAYLRASVQSVPASSQKGAA
jgi:DNA-binding transcriptional regulator YdaS (Cro superfamily)